MLRSRRISALRGQLFGGDFITLQMAVFSHSKIGGGKPKRLRRLEFSSGNEKKEFPITPSLYPFVSQTIMVEESGISSTMS